MLTAAESRCFWTGVDNFDRRVALNGAKGWNGQLLRFGSGVGIIQSRAVATAVGADPLSRTLSPY
jgi:hypothetical protein